jgi:tetratricopeptide (TPR) repeat protein
VSHLGRMGRRGVIATLAFALQLAADPAVFDQRKASIRTLLDQHDFSAALKEAKLLNVDWPDDIMGYQLLAESQLGIGDYEDAERTIQWMLDLRIGKADAAGWLLVARFREITGDIEGALDAVNFANSRLPAEIQRNFLLIYSARLHLLAGRLDVAESSLKAAGANNHPLAIDTLLRVRAAQGRRDEALLAVRGQADSLHPRQMYVVAGISGERGYYEAFERAARARIKSMDNANVELALYYAGPGKRPSEALRIARQEATRRHDVNTMCALAVALFANGQTAEAKSTMLNVLAVGTRDPDILRHADRMEVKPK